MKPLFRGRENTEPFQHKVRQGVCENDKDLSRQDRADAFQKVHIRSSLVVIIAHCPTLPASCSFAVKLRDQRIDRVHRALPLFDCFFCFSFSRISFSAMRALTNFLTSAVGSGLSDEKRMVPLDVS